MDPSVEEVIVVASVDGALVEMVVWASEAVVVGALVKVVVWASEAVVVGALVVEQDAPAAVHVHSCILSAAANTGQALCLSTSKILQ